MSEGLHLNSTICIPLQHSGGKGVYIDEQIDLALDQNQCLTDTLIIWVLEALPNRQIPQASDGVRTMFSVLKPREDTQNQTRQISSSYPQCEEKRGTPIRSHYLSGWNHKLG